LIIPAFIIDAAP